MNLKEIKDRALSIIVPLAILGALFLWCKHLDKKEATVPLSIESRYDLNILAKKYDIPLATAQEISLHKDKVKNPDGSTNWKATIEYIARDTGISEKVISAFLFDANLIENFSGNYDDSNYE